MADYKKEGGTSFLGGALATGALTYGGYKSWQSWSSRVDRSPILPAYDASAQLTGANTTLRDFASKYKSPSGGGRQTRFVNTLDKLMNNTALTTDQIKMLTRMAASRADPTGQLWSTLNKQLGSAATSSQMLEHLKRIAQSGNNIYTDRVLQHLLPDLVKLNRAAKTGKIIDPIPPAQSRIEAVTGHTYATGGIHGSLTPGFEKEVDQIRAILGTRVESTLSHRPEVPGTSITLRVFQNKQTPAFEVRIPQEVMPGVVVQGETQQTRYIAGQFAILDKNKVASTMSYDEFYANRIRAELIPQMQNLRPEDKWGARRLRSSFESKMREYLDYLGPVPAEVHQGIEKQISSRANILRMFTLDDAGVAQPLGIFDQAAILERGGVDLADGGFQKLYPGFSATQAGKGVMSTVDIREGVYLVPELGPHERKPGGIVRERFAPSAKARAAMEQNKITQKFKWASAKAGVDAPFGRTTYISSVLANRVVNSGITTEGQGLVSRRMIKQLGQTTWSTFDIALGGVPGHPGPSKELVDLLGSGGTHWDMNKNAAKDFFLGYDPSGSAKFLPSDMRLPEATVFNDLNKGDFLRVTALKDIEDMRTAKFFGHKEMAMFRGDNYIEGLAKQMGLEHTGRIDYLMTMDELKKNRSLHYNQMFTGLYDFIHTNNQRGLKMGQLSRAYLDKPVDEIARIRKLATSNGMFQHEVALSEMLNIARDANLHSWKVGQVFGAVPEAMSDLGGLDKLFASGALTLSEIEAINKGQARGASQLFFGGLGKSQGAGGLGSIEPRVFELLSGQQYGELGPALQQDILLRQLASQPGRQFEYNELMTSLQSITDPVRRDGALAAKDILGQTGEGLKAVNAGKGLPSGPTSLHVSGFGDVYIPGATQLSQLAGYKTATGTMTHAPIVGAYRDLIESAAAFDKGEIGREILDSNLTRVRNEIALAATATATGKGGVVRSKVPGSLYLRAMVPTREMKLAEGAVGITSRDFSRMMKNMKELGVYDQAQLGQMATDFRANKPVAAAVWRHPAIGQYSTQPVLLQKVRMGKKAARELEGHLFIPETLFTGTVATRAGEVAEMTAANPIRLSPFVGMTGDVDGDIMSLMVAGPQLQDKMKTFISDKNFQTAYRDHSLMIQTLKAKAKGQTTIQKMIADAQIKLSTTEGGILGQVSTKLQAYRAALSMDASGLLGQAGGGERISKAMTLLEWLEQMPISGKHIAPGQAGNTLTAMGNLIDVLGKGDVEEITQSARGFLELGTPQARSLLEEGATFNLRPLQGGPMEKINVQGIEVESAVRDIVEARDSIRNMKVDGVSAERMRRLAMGKVEAGQMTNSDIKAIMSTEATTMSNLLVTARGVKGTGTFSSISSRVLAETNKLGAAGKKLLPHAKPLLLGSAVGLGIATILSKPPVLLPTGSTAPPPANQISLESGRASDRMPTNVHPEGGMHARPTVSNPIPKTARIAPPQQGYRIRAEALSDKNADYRAMGRQLSNGVRGSSHSTVSDRRDTLTPQKLASILRGE